MHAVRRQAHEGERVRRQLPRLDHQPEDGGQGEHVQRREDELGEADVPARVGEEVEAVVDPDEAGGVDEGAGVAAEEGVVVGAVAHALHLLHVGHPVDLGVGHAQNDAHVEDALSDEESQRCPPGELGVEDQAPA